MAWLTAMVFILLWIGPMDFFDSLCHAFSTMSTGGFSTRNNSIAEWDSDYIKIIVTIDTRAQFFMSYAGYFGIEHLHAS